MHFITKKSFFSILIFGALLVTTGCGSRSHKAAGKASSVYLKQYIMHVEGVECKFCAQTVMDLVTKIPGVSRVCYHTTDDTYEVSHLTFAFDPKSDVLPIEQIKAGLTKEGFSLVSLKNRSQETANGLPASGM